MAFSRPTLTQIIDRVRGDIKNELSISTILRRSFLSAFARALAGVAHMLHGHLVYVSRQLFPDQAELEFLERWGSIWSLERRAATAAQLNITITFTAAATVPAGTTFQRSDGAEYTLDSEVSASGAGTETGVVSASAAGDAGNLDAGSTITLVSPIADVESDAEVASTAIEGEDEETDAQFRQRIVDRIQNPPQGGNVEDYKGFVTDVEGPTRVWIRPDGLGEGTVLIWFVEDNEDPIFPSAAKIAEVLAAVNEKKPVTADVTVASPTEQTMDLTIKLDPNTAAVQAAVTAELEDMLLRDGQVGGSYKQAGETYSGTIAISKIREAVSRATGEDDNELVSPTADVTTSTGRLITLGTITFQDLP